MKGFTVSSLQLFLFKFWEYLWSISISPLIGVKERIRVQVFDSKYRTALYALENQDDKLSCIVEGKLNIYSFSYVFATWDELSWNSPILLSQSFTDEITGERVEPLSYKWEIRHPKLGWDENIQSEEIAKSVSGINSRELELNGLSVAKNDHVSSSYQLRCVAQYNETYYVVSRGYAVNVHRTPEVKAIKFIREKPEQMELTGEPARDIYDAKGEYLVICKPDAFAGETHAIWEKYDAETGEWEEVVPALDKIFFEAESTEYEDEGEYRCKVTHKLPNYDYVHITTRVLELKRIGMFIIKLDLTTCNAIYVALVLQIVSNIKGLQ